MKHSFNKIALVVVASAFSHAALAVDTATANTTAVVVDNLEIVKVADLDFGEIVALNAARTITVAPADGASFTVTGDEGFTYSVTTEASDLVGTEDDTRTMTVSDVTVTGNEDLSGGTDTLQVGATLNVGANQADDTYTGELDVTVAYTGIAEEEGDFPDLPGPGDVPPPPGGP